MTRRVLFPLLFVLLLGVLWAAPARAVDDDLIEQRVQQALDSYAKKHGNDFDVAWKNGLKFSSKNGLFSLGIHGRLMLDYTFFGSVDESLETATGSQAVSGYQFRRAWLTFAGGAYKHLAYVAQFGLEHGDILFLDVWLGLKNLQDCFGCLAPDIRVGHYQEPFGLAWLTSSKYLQMCAWPLPTTTFTPGYNPGVMARSTAFGDRATATLGFFGNTPGLEPDGEWESGYSVTGRLTCLPWAPCDCEHRYLHLGLNGSYRGEISTARFFSRADFDVGPTVVDTGVIPADQSFLVDLELAFVYDRFNIQAEVAGAQVDAVSGTDPFFWGGYVQAGYMLSGAPGRTYLKKTGTFGPTKVCRNFLGANCCGAGAFELAARLDYVDLDDGDKQGGQARDILVGFNWYANTNMRVMVNYVFGDVENAHGSRNSADSDGSLDGLVVRFAVYW